MITILCLIIFAVVTLYQVRYASGGSLTLRLPQDRNKVMRFTGQEALIICIFATAPFTVLPAAHRVEVCKVSSGKTVKNSPRFKYNPLKTSFQGHR